MNSLSIFLLCTGFARTLLLIRAQSEDAADDRLEEAQIADVVTQLFQIVRHRFTALLKPIYYVPHRSQNPYDLVEHDAEQYGKCNNCDARNEEKNVRLQNLAHMEIIPYPHFV